MSRSLGLKWRCGRALLTTALLGVVPLGAESAAQVMMQGPGMHRDSMGPMHRKRDHEAIGTGVGIGLAVGGALQQLKPPKDAPASTPRKGRAAKPKPKKPPAAKKDIAKRPAPQPGPAAAAPSVEKLEPPRAKETAEPPVTPPPPPAIPATAPPPPPPAIPATTSAPPPQFKPLLPPNPATPIPAPLPGDIAGPRFDRDREMEKQLSERIPDSVCGPDITENVLDVLQQIHDTYWKKWIPEERRRACKQLINPLTGGSAWDILELSPSGSASKLLVIPAGQECAQPRPACEMTVEFLGTCQHPQVVNYVQWGMMLSLCSSTDQTFDSIADQLHGMRNAFLDGWGLIRDGASAVPTQGQNNMIEFGRQFSQALDGGYPKGALPPAVMDRMTKRFQRSERINPRPELKCSLSCKSERASRILKDWKFKYTWEPLISQQK